MSAFKVCGCGREFTAREWVDLPNRKIFDIDADHDRRGEQRDCPCGSSIAVDRAECFVELRAAEKQASREADARALASGEKTPEELRKENGVFGFGGIVEIDFSKTKKLY